MTDAITIPKAVEEAVAKQLYEEDWRDNERKWEDAPQAVQTVYRGLAAIAIHTALRAWPGMFFYKYGDDGSEAIILPLSKEPEGDDAHEFVSDWYRPARCVNCGQTRNHAFHKEPKV